MSHLPAQPPGGPPADPWRSFEHDPRRAANATLRASDRDRDAVSSILGAAYAEGRLTPEELDQRAEANAAAKLLGDLPPLIADVVPSVALERASADPHTRAVERYTRDRRQAGRTMLTASLICWAVWVFTSFGGGSFDAQFPWPLFVMLGTGINFGRTAFDRQDRIAELERKYERSDAKRERKRLEGPSA